MKILVFFIACIMFISCKSTRFDDEKVGVISTIDMKYILKERHLKVAEWKETQHNLSFDEKDSILNQIHIQLGYNNASFDSSWIYYSNRNPEKLTQLYREILEEVKLMQSELQ